MADIADDANDRAQRDLERAIQAARSLPPIVANGACLYCHEPVAEEKRFCGTDCREDFEREKRVRARQGLR